MTDPVTTRLKAEIDKAWDDPRPSRPANELFDRIEVLHEQTLARLAGEGAERE